MPDFLPPFEAPILKVQWAKRRIAELAAEMAAYEKSDAFRLTIKPKMVTIERVKPVPAQIPMILGDAIHNLRTALDLLASDMARLRGKDPKSVYFPFALNSLNLKKEADKSHFYYCGLDAMALLERVKPYKGGNDLLRALHDLDNMDKHQLLVPVLQTFQVHGLVLDGPDGKIESDVHVPGDAIDVSGGEYATATYRSITCIAAFGAGTPHTVDGHVVLEVLEHFTQLVSGIVQQFRSLKWGALVEKSPTAPVGNDGKVEGGQTIIIGPGKTGGFTAG